MKNQWLEKRREKEEEKRKDWSNSEWVYTTDAYACYTVSSACVVNLVFNDSQWEMTGFFSQA
jgi:hypothetical protein